MNMHANTVGITEELTKDIYVIKNDINDKVYVGQSIDPKKRFEQHCKPSAAKQNSLIDRAIQKYGEEHFWYEIQEKQVEDYNEKEKYWIRQQGALNPHGYNLNVGGEDPPHYRNFEHQNASLHNWDEVHQIKGELRNTQMSLAEIGKLHNVSKKTVMRINQGLQYEELNETYPIRVEPNLNGKLTDEQVCEIIEILRISYRQYEDIARQYGISISAVKQINSGDCHPLPNIKYPIRTYKNSGKPACTYAQVQEIIDLLLHSTISCNEIAKRYDVELNTVYAINSGSAKRYQDESLTYPLRQFNRKRKR